MTRLSTALAVLLATAAPALSEGYVYADFEASVPHIDLPECPEGLAAEPAFCRVTLNNHAVHVHVFAEAGEQPFLGVHSYYEEEFGLLPAD